MPTPHSQPPPAPPRAGPGRPWRAMAAGMAALAGVLILVEGQAPAGGAMRLSVHASLLATLLLAIAATLYVAHALAGDRQLGHAARALSAAGACGVACASFVRWVEVEWLTPGTFAFAGEYEALTWMAVIAVCLHLCIEDAYRTHLAGGVVVPAALAALALAAWLIAGSPAPDRTFMALAEAYVAEAARWSAQGGILAYGAVGAIAAAGWRRQHRDDGPRPEPATWARALRRIMVAGFCALLLAAMLLAGRSLLGGTAPGGALGRTAWAPGPVLLLGCAVLLAWALRRAPQRMLHWWLPGAVALAVYCAYVPFAAPVAGNAPAANLLPRLQLAAVDRGTAQLDATDGRVLVLNVWARWCGPCREELPSLERLNRQLDPAQFRVVGIALEDDRAGVAEFLRARGIGYPNFLPADRAAATALLGAATLPLTIVYAPDGTPAARIVGARAWDSPAQVATIHAARGATRGNPARRISHAALQDRTFRQ